MISDLCGMDLPQEVVTPGPRLVLLFNSGSVPAAGFKAKFFFETGMLVLSDATHFVCQISLQKITFYLSAEYLIPIGTPAPDGSCDFTYRSSSRKEGRFNSPRHPSNYPSSTNCTYTFLASQGEQVQIVFDSFKVRIDNIFQNNSLGAWKAYG